jgi:hypothetical protein
VFTTANPETSNLAAIFGRVWDGDSALSVPLARHVLKLRFSEPDVTRMRELTAKNRSGVLSDAESSELDNFVRVGDLLAILQSKARMRLKRKVRATRG